jgi:hypothetical protein
MTPRRGARLPRPWVFGPLAALPAAIFAELAGCREARIDTGSALGDIATWYVVFAIGFALSAWAARKPP